LPGSLGTWAPGMAGAVIMFGLIILVGMTIFDQLDDAQGGVEVLGDSSCIFNFQKINRH